MSNITSKDLKTLPRPEGDFEDSPVNSKDYKEQLDEANRKIIENAESMFYNYITNDNGSLNKRSINTINKSGIAKLRIGQSQYEEVGVCTGELEIARKKTDTPNDDYSDEPIKFHFKTVQTY